MGPCDEVGPVESGPLCPEPVVPPLWPDPDALGADPVGVGFEESGPPVVGLATVLVEGGPTAIFF